jgi:hypothetical protein
MALQDTLEKKSVDLLASLDTLYLNQTAQSRGASEELNGHMELTEETQRAYLRNAEDVVKVWWTLPDKVSGLRV